MTITERLKYLSKISLKLDFSDYLTVNEKELIVFEIKTLNERYILKEGRDIDNILAKSNESYTESKAGYLVDINTVFETQVKADLILLSDIVLNSNPNDLDTIIIHEIVHMLINSGQEGHIEITESASIIGNEIYQITDQHNQEETQHTEVFCNILAQACLNYYVTTKNYETPQLTIRRAMRFDIFE